MNRELLILTIADYFPGVVFETLSEKSERKIWDFICSCYKEDSQKCFDLQTFSKNKLMNPLFPPSGTKKSDFIEIQDMIMKKQLPGGVFQYYMDKEDRKFLKQIPYINKNTDFVLSLEYINMIGSRLLLNVIDNINNVSLKWNLESLFFRVKPTSLYKGYYRFEEINFSEILIALEEQNITEKEQDFNIRREQGQLIINKLIIKGLHDLHIAPEDGLNQENMHLEYNDIYFEIFYDILEKFFHKADTYKLVGYQELEEKILKIFSSEVHFFIKNGKKIDYKLTKENFDSDRKSLDSFINDFYEYGNRNSNQEILSILDSLINCKRYEKIENLYQLSLKYPNILSRTKHNNLRILYTKLCAVFANSDNCILSKIEDENNNGYQPKGYIHNNFIKLEKLFANVFSLESEKLFLSYVQDEILVQADTLDLDIRKIFINPENKHFYEREWFPLYKKYCEPCELTEEEFITKMRLLNIESRKLEN